MNPVLSNIAARVDAQQFPDLFLSLLGWDNPPDPRPVRHSNDESGESFTATPVAAKRGVVVYHCNIVPAADDIEDLDRAVGRRSIERLLIFTSGSEQQWRWPEPRKSGGTRYVTHRHIVGVPNPALFQRLSAVRFSLEEENDLTVLAVRERVRASFNSDEVTNRFYNEFQENQQALMGEIDGIQGAESRAWYSSLLLNRLMFIYFMQRKGFLNSDHNYLRNSLKAVQALKGEDRFYEFYRDFLVPLFHEGLGSERSDRRIQDAAIAKVIGDVPYLNGGIFAIHPLEEANTIRVPDSIFERVFTFFDHYRWHLNERPTGNPEEINPEVLGYIFEKYVNQKAQGAYYTHEDVTGYMAGSVIAPVFIDRLCEAIGTSPWYLLESEPTQFVREGLAYGRTLPLPDAVAQANPHDTAVLHQYADPDCGVPGERWRETVDRRNCYDDLVARLARGEVDATDGAVSHNLDLLEVALRWVETLDAPEDTAAAYEVLRSLRILDPTCGSGAFLFAALDVLSEIYGAVLRRAGKHIATDEDTSDGQLAGVCETIDAHPSGEYFILKTIVLSNLYGVDLMIEATEIARLRLFLALVAKLDDRSQIEPLPDLDMNIRAGNLLVGSATAEDAEVRFQGDLLAKEQLPGIAAGAREAASLYRQFVDAQQAGIPARSIEVLKARLNATNDVLRERLDLLFSPSSLSRKGFDAWRASHHPFHWFVEFPEVMARGGFDAVIGNPPYVAKSKISTYRYSGFATDAARDIFAPCMERSASLVASGGRYSMIVPIAFQFSGDYESARHVIGSLLPRRWVSTYSRNPSALFDAGLGVRSTIVFGLNDEVDRQVLTTDLRRWWEDGRPYLFDTNRYTAVPVRRDGDPWPRTGHSDLADLYLRLTSSRRSLGEALARAGHPVGFKKTALYYVSVFIDEPPSWTPGGKRIPQSQVGELRFDTEESRDVAFVMLAGRLACWWWAATGDDFHITNGLLTSFPIAPAQMKPIWRQLRGLAKQLRREQPKHPVVTKYAGNEMGNYDMLRCRHITDQADALVLEALGIGYLWPAVLLADARMAKATGERPGTEREWPFEWQPTGT